jgi:hypothetical protein
MGGPVSLHFSSPPRIIPAYARILLARKPAVLDGAMPRIEATLARFAIDPRHVARYRKVCGDRGSDALPITYPHILATPVHLAMIASEAFPISLLGVVHTRNRIVQHRPLHAHDTGSIRAWIEGFRESSRGQELALQTELAVGSELIWCETSTFLVRHRERRRPAARSGDGSLPTVEVPPREVVATSAFVVNPHVGREYARISGDFNPIHIADLGARFFGLKRAIVHGMWSLARCTAEIDAATFSQPCTLDVAFRRPIAFRTAMVLESWMSDGRVGFSLREAQTDRGHLLGSVVRAG